MDRTERLYKIDQMLNDRKIVPLDSFLDELGVSLATFKRDLEYMRERFNAPIEWDREAGGYRFAQNNTHGPAYSLPGFVDEYPYYGYYMCTPIGGFYHDYAR